MYRTCSIDSAEIHAGPGGLQGGAQPGGPGTRTGKLSATGCRSRETRGSSCQTAALLLGPGWTHAVARHARLRPAHWPKTSSDFSATATLSQVSTTTHFAAPPPFTCSSPTYRSCHRRSDLPPITSPASHPSTALPTPHRQLRHPPAQPLPPSKPVARAGAPPASGAVYSHLPKPRRHRDAASSAAAPQPQRLSPLLLPPRVSGRAPAPPLRRVAAPGMPAAVRSRSRRCLYCLGHTSARTCRPGPDGPRSLCRACHARYVRKKLVLYARYHPRASRPAALSLVPFRHAVRVRVVAWSTAHNGRPDLMAPIVRPVAHSPPPPAEPPPPAAAAPATTRAPRKRPRDGEGSAAPDGTSRHCAPSRGPSRIVTSCHVVGAQASNNMTLPSNGTRRVSFKLDAPSHSAGRERQSSARVTGKSLCSHDPHEAHAPGQAASSGIHCVGRDAQYGNDGGKSASCEQSGIRTSREIVAAQANTNMMVPSKCARRVSFELDARSPSAGRERQLSAPVTRKFLCSDRLDEADAPDQAASKRMHRVDGQISKRIAPMKQNKPSSSQPTDATGSRSSIPQRLSSRTILKMLTYMPPTDLEEWREEMKGVVQVDRDTDESSSSSEESEQISDGKEDGVIRVDGEVDESSSSSEENEKSGAEEDDHSYVHTESGEEEVPQEDVRAVERIRVAARQDAREDISSSSEKGSSQQSSDNEGDDHADVCTESGDTELGEEDVGRTKRIHVATPHYASAGESRVELERGECLRCARNRRDGVESRSGHCICSLDRDIETSAMDTSPRKSIPDDVSRAGLYPDERPLKQDSSSYHAMSLKHLHRSSNKSSAVCSEAERALRFRRTERENDESGADPNCMSPLKKRPKLRTRVNEGNNKSDEIAESGNAWSGRTRQNDSNPFSASERKHRVRHLLAYQVSTFLLTVHKEYSVQLGPLRLWMKKTLFEMLARIGEELKGYSSFEDALESLFHRLGQTALDLRWFERTWKDEYLGGAKGNYMTWEPPPTEEEWKAEAALLRFISEAFSRVLKRHRVGHNETEIETCSSIVNMVCSEALHGSERIASPLNMREAM